MKEKGLFTMTAFTKAISTILDNFHFMAWLNNTFHIKLQDGAWIQYDPNIGLKGIERREGYSTYEMTDWMLHWFYESYATEERMNRESRDFVSLDANIASSNVIITKPKKKQHASIDATIAAIIDDLDWTAIKPLQTRYATGSVEKDIRREQIRRFYDTRLNSFPFEKYNGILDDDEINRFAELMVQLPSDLYTKMLELSLSETETIAPLFIYQPCGADGTRKKAKDKVNHARIADRLGISRSAMKKRLDKIYKKIYYGDRSAEKNARKAVYDRRAKAEKDMYAALDAALAEKVAAAEAILANQAWREQSVEESGCNI